MKQSLDGYMGVVVVVNLLLMIVMAQMAGQKSDYALGLTSDEPGSAEE